MIMFYGMTRTHVADLWLRATDGREARPVRVAKADQCKISCDAANKPTDTVDRVHLPVPLRLGLTERQVRNLLGEPTVKYRNTVIFDHEHEETIRGESRLRIG